MQSSKISQQIDTAFFYEEVVITTDPSHIGSSVISCCFPIFLPFLIMSIWHLTFNDSAFTCAAFLVTQPLFNLLPTFQGTHEEVATLLNLAHPYMVSCFFSFSQFVFIKIFNFQVAPLSMLDAGGWEGCCNYRVRKAFYNFIWTCQWHLWTLTGINGRSKPLTSEFDTPWYAYYFFLSLSYLILFLMIEQMELVQLWHLLAQPHRTWKVAGCWGCATSPFVYSWSINPIQWVSAHTCCLSCCTSPLWAWYPGIIASSITCQVAVCHPPSHGKFFNQWFLCYHLLLTFSF